MIFPEAPKHAEIDLMQPLQRQRLPQSIGFKRLTFSFDDGVRQDVRLLEILNRYRLKATFNLNSALMGKDMTVSAYGKTFRSGILPPMRFLMFITDTRLLHIPEHTAT